jgi:hypothetical protein
VDERVAQEPAEEGDTDPFGIKGFRPNGTGARPQLLNVFKFRRRRRW